MVFRLTGDDTQIYLTKDTGPQGASGVTAPASGFFTLQVDPNGDLYAVYADTATASEAPVSYDPTTGDLYYMINDGK